MTRAQSALAAAAAMLLVQAGCHHHHFHTVCQSHCTHAGLPLETMMGLDNSQCHQGVPCPDCAQPALEDSRNSTWGGYTPSHSDTPRRLPQGHAPVPPQQRGTDDVAREDHSSVRNESDAIIVIAPLPESSRGEDESAATQSRSPASTDTLPTEDTSETEDERLAPPRNIIPHIRQSLRQELEPLVASVSSRRGWVRNPHVDNVDEDAPFWKILVE